MGFRVTQAGFSATIQDRGRFGYQHLGVTQGGAIDEYSYRWANRLLHNADSDAVIEVTYGGFEVEFDCTTNIALTGADLHARLNGRLIPIWHTAQVREGDRLSFSHPREGLRAYLAVSGGVLSPLALGSRSVVVREGLGGINNAGQKLANNDYLQCDAHTHIRSNRVPDFAVPRYTGTLELGVVEGYQIADFTRADIRRFYSSDYQVTNHIDRMGYRLNGAGLKPTKPGIVSEGIALGAIQIPADGQPIVLMADRQTIGGYPKLGCVNSLDLCTLAQSGPGTVVRFYAADVEKVQAQRLIFEKSLKHFSLDNLKT